MANVNFLFVIEVNYAMKCLDKVDKKGHTHKWQFSIVPLNDCVLKFVEFVLHPTFEEPEIMFYKGPYKIQKSGYGIFDMTINMNIFDQTFSEIYPIILYTIPRESTKKDYFILNCKLNASDFALALQNGGIPAPVDTMTDAIIGKIKSKLVSHGPGWLPQDKYTDLYNFVKFGTAVVAPRLPDIPQKQQKEKIELKINQNSQKLIRPSKRKTVIVPEKLLPCSDHSLPSPKKRNQDSDSSSNASSMIFSEERRKNKVSANINANNVNENKRRQTMSLEFPRQNKEKIEKQNLSNPNTGNERRQTHDFGTNNPRILKGKHENLNPPKPINGNEEKQKQTVLKENPRKFKERNETPNLQKSSSENEDRQKQSLKIEKSINIKERNQTLNNYKSSSDNVGRQNEKFGMENPRPMKERSKTSKALKPNNENNVKQNHIINNENSHKFKEKTEDSLKSNSKKMKEINGSLKHNNRESFTESNGQRNTKPIAKDIIPNPFESSDEESENKSPIIRKTVGTLNHQIQRGKSIKRTLEADDMNYQGNSPKRQRFNDTLGKTTQGKGKLPQKDNPSKIDRISSKFGQQITDDDEDDFTMKHDKKRFNGNDSSNGESKIDKQYIKQKLGNEQQIFPRENNPRFESIEQDLKKKRINKEKNDTSQVKKKFNIKNNLVSNVTNSDSDFENFTRKLPNPNNTINRNSSEFENNSPSTKRLPYSNKPDRNRPVKRDNFHSSPNDQIGQYKASVSPVKKKISTKNDNILKKFHPNKEESNGEGKNPKTLKDPAPNGKENKSKYNDIGRIKPKITTPNQLPKRKPVDSDSDSEDHFNSMRKSPNSSNSSFQKMRNSSEFESKAPSTKQLQYSNKPDRNKGKDFHSSTNEDKYMSSISPMKKKISSEYDNTIKKYPRTQEEVMGEGKAQKNVQNEGKYQKSLKDPLPNRKENRTDQFQVKQKPTISNNSVLTKRKPVDSCSDFEDNIAYMRKSPNTTDSNNNSFKKSRNSSEFENDNLSVKLLPYSDKSDENKVICNDFHSSPIDRMNGFKKSVSPMKKKISHKYDNILKKVSKTKNEFIDEDNEKKNTQNQGKYETPSRDSVSARREKKTYFDSNENQKNENDKTNYKESYMKSKPLIEFQHSGNLGPFPSTNDNFPVTKNPPQSNPTLKQVDMDIKDSPLKDQTNKKILNLKIPKKTVVEEVNSTLQINRTSLQDIHRERQKEKIIRKEEKRALKNQPSNLEGDKRANRDSQYNSSPKERNHYHIGSKIAKPNNDNPVSDRENQTEINWKKESTFEKTIVPQVVSKFIENEKDPKKPNVFHQEFDSCNGISKNSFALEINQNKIIDTSNKPSVKLTFTKQNMITSTRSIFDYPEIIGNGNDESLPNIKIPEKAIQPTEVQIPKEDTDRNSTRDTSKLANSNLDSHHKNNDYYRKKDDQLYTNRKHRHRSDSGSRRSRSNSKRKEQRNDHYNDKYRRKDNDYKTTRKRESDDMYNNEDKRKMSYREYKEHKMMENKHNSIPERTEYTSRKPDNVYEKPSSNKHYSRDSGTITNTIDSCHNELKKISEIIPEPSSDVKVEVQPSVKSNDKIPHEPSLDIKSQNQYLFEKYELNTQCLLNKESEIKNDDEDLDDKMDISSEEEDFPSQDPIEKCNSEVLKTKDSMNKKADFMLDSDEEAWINSSKKDNINKCENSKEQKDPKFDMKPVGHRSDVVEGCAMNWKYENVNIAQQQTDIPKEQDTSQTSVDSPNKPYIKDDDMVHSYVADELGLFNTDFKESTPNIPISHDDKVLDTLAAQLFPSNNDDYEMEVESQINSPIIDYGNNIVQPDYDIYPQLARPFDVESPGHKSDNYSNLTDPIDLDEPESIQGISFIERVRLKEEIANINDESFYISLHHLLYNAICALEDGLDIKDDKMVFNMSLISDSLVRDMRSLVDQTYPRILNIALA